MNKNELHEIGICESDTFEDAAIIYKELYICYFVRRKQKRETEESFEFARNAGVYIDELVRRLTDYSFRIEKFNKFKIHNPERIINAPDEIDRLGEFWLCHKYVKSYLMGLLKPRDDLIQTDINLFPRLYVNNMACQEGKGSAETMRRMDLALSQAHILYGNDFYVFQYDVKKFYDNIAHDVAKELFKELPLCAYKTLCNVIDSYKCTADDPNCYAIKDNPDRTYGLPKGTLVSQWVGVKLLDDLDRALSELRGAIFEIRYADDCLCFFRTKYEARHAMEFTQKYLERANLGIKLNSEKTSYYKVSRGINFCGWNYMVMPDHTVIKRLITKKKKEQYGEFKDIQHLYRNNIITYEQVVSKYRGIFAHLSHGDTFRLRRYYQNRFYLSHNKKHDKEDYNEKEKNC